MTDNDTIDMRDMYLSHTMFRRELRLAPGLVRAVPPGDRARAGVVAEHIRLVALVLHHHHRSEDDYLWPRLLVRAQPEAGSVVAVMEKQHLAIDAAVTDVNDGLATWPDTADPGAGAALAAALDRLVELLVEHLAVEEDQAIPLIERHITQAEWTEMIGGAAAGMEPQQMPLVFGMMSYEGDADTVRDIIAGMPPEVRPMIAAAPAAYAEYAQRVHGTATPDRVGQP
jgi:hemerythrin-like domain-containing protein